MNNTILNGCSSIPLPCKTRQVSVTAVAQWRLVGSHVISDQGGDTRGSSRTIIIDGNCDHRLASCNTSRHRQWPSSIPPFANNCSIMLFGQGRVTCPTPGSKSMLYLAGQRICIICCQRSGKSDRHYHMFPVNLHQYLPVYISDCVCIMEIICPIMAQLVKSRWNSRLLVSGYYNILINVQSLLDDLSEGDQVIYMEKGSPNFQENQNITSFPV